MARTSLSAAASRGASGLLPKERRLRSREDFDKLFAKGRVLKRPVFRIVWAVGTGKVGVVSAKSLGSNAHRNLVRRRWREALRRCELPQEVDFILVVGLNGAHLRGTELFDALNDGLLALREDFAREYGSQPH